MGFAYNFTNFVPIFIKTQKTGISSLNYTGLIPDTSFSKQYNSLTYGM